MFNINEFVLILINYQYLTLTVLTMNVSLIIRYVFFWRLQLLFLQFIAFSIFASKKGRKIFLRMITKYFFQHTLRLFLYGLYLKIAFYWLLDNFVTYFRKLNSIKVQLELYRNSFTMHHKKRGILKILPNEPLRKSKKSFGEQL